MIHKDTIMYAHGSAYNHGCEAIVRSTADLLSLEKEHTRLYSNRIEGDREFCLDDIVQVEPIAETPVDHNSLLGMTYRLRSHLHKDHEFYYYRYFGKRQYQYMYDYGQAAMSIGGDNYCYSSALTGLEVRNYWLNKKNFKTILWGASLSPEFMSPEIVDDMNRYALITVREKMSFELLKNRGVRTDIVCGPDPAFALKPMDMDWPDGRTHTKVIGINISPFVMECEAAANSGLMNYVNLINWILMETDYEIALIPHVVFPDGTNNDILLADKLLQYFPENHRIFKVEGKLNCCQLKSLIAKCSFFIGARTHSTIAAYSSMVPTIVVGYSVKSIGIARDIFGTDRDYVCSVQNMTDEQMLLKAFCRKFKDADKIRKYLSDFIPEYLKGYRDCIEAANAILR